MNQDQTNDELNDVRNEIYNTIRGYVTDRVVGDLTEILDDRVGERVEILLTESELDDRELSEYLQDDTFNTLFYKTDFFERVCKSIIERVIDGRG